MKATMATSCVVRRASLTLQRLPCVGAKTTALTTRSRRHASSNNQKIPDYPKSSNKASIENSTAESSQQEIQYIIPKSFAIGSCAGIMGSLAGMGGGFVMIPLMTSSRLLNLTQHQAHGTSATGVAGALGYQGHVQYDAAAAIAACGIVTAGIGASVTTHLSSSSLKRALGIFMILVAPLVPLKGYLQELDKNKKETENDAVSHDNNDKPLANSASTWQQRLLPPAMIGLGSGFLAGLFGVGGGAVVVPALTLFTDVNHYQALGTSLCAMAFPAISGTITHFRQGNVAMRVAPALAAGAFCGGYIGGRLGLKTNEDALRWGFSVLMVTLGARMLIR
jgi:uncharacterized protein